MYSNIPLFWSTLTICFNHSKFETEALPRVMPSNDVDIIADSEVPHQTALSYLSLHCLPRPISLKTNLHYDID